MLIQVARESGYPVIRAEFIRAKDFYKWQREYAPNLRADLVIINDMVMLGWDEIEEELG